MENLFARMQLLDWPGVRYCQQETFITNFVEIYASPSGRLHFLASSDDYGVREFNVQRYQPSKHLRIPWPVNASPLHCMLETIEMVLRPPNWKEFCSCHHGTAMLLFCHWKLGTDLVRFGRFATCQSHQLLI
ncbi:hypothetical protein TorRG33x02_193390 [Trema orientale]|uniref:Uncharacterized protein n=1 Tax=Trema orientale TaxID=63057 RepID=A0A2P5EGV1_TREOI|nr:hypothetical protein TorRG33x02_193390 [Trema orientale]